MKRILISLAVIVGVLVTAGFALAGGKHARIKLRSTSLGRILVNGHGFTVYEYSKDRRNKDNCMAVQNCTTFWPPVTSAGKPIAGKGVKASRLGTIKLPNGKRQVTYAGHPLYTYKFDTSPGETSYVGVFASGGHWYALRSSGRRVK